MKKQLLSFLSVYPTAAGFNFGMLFFRTAVAVEMIMVHGLKKIGIGTQTAEQIPNPLLLPDTINSLVAISANLLFPILVIFGFVTRLAIVPILAVTLTGYFALHWNDTGAVKDIPFMYSIAYLLIMVLGPGRYSIDFLLYKNSGPTYDC